jgi:hypothetical protein
MQCPGVAVSLQAILSESWKKTSYKTSSNMRGVTIMCVVCVMCRSFKSIRLSSVLG